MRNSGKSFRVSGEQVLSHNAGRKLTQPLFLVLIICLFGSAAFGQPWDGGGVEGDPYLIYTAEDMQAVGANPDYWDAHFKLMANIDLSAYTGTSFNLIGSKYIEKPNGIAIDVDSGKIYWTNTYAAIVMANLDLTGPEYLVKTGLISPDGIALDVGGGKMYWTDLDTDKIQRSNLDGTNVEDVVTTGLSTPHGIALDVSGNKMYWTDMNTDKIQRSNLDGTNVEDIVTTGISSPIGIALDVVGGKMYWAALNDKIQRSNLDGTGVETLVTTGLQSPYGIALDIVGGKMYWTDLSQNKIQRANLNGTNVEDLVTSDLNGPKSIALDVANGKMYWTEYDSPDRIRRANMDGTGVGGINAKNFGGVFDGNGHTISNFSYDSDGSNAIGLFRYVEGPSAEIKNLGLINPNIDAGTGGIVGSLVGYLGNSAVTRCYSVSCSVSGNLWVGGLVGESYGGTIIKCSVSGTVSATDDLAGGLAGLCMEGVIISDCYTEGNVSAGEGTLGGEAGGLVGHIREGIISDCFSTADVYAEEMTGGLVGGINFSSSILRCYAMGNISGIDWCAGGLVGYSNNNSVISDSYATGAVSVPQGIVTGGLVGSNSATVLRCYATGRVSGKDNVGGLVGYEYSGDYRSCFWDNTVNPDMNGIGTVSDSNVIGETTSNMQTESTFTSVGWDFVGEVINGPNDIWDICEGTNYPKLTWQIPVDGDFVCPDGVDWSDLAVLCEEWLFEELSGDVWPEGGDGIVNFLDWAIFADSWQTTVDYDGLADFVEQWLGRALSADVWPGGGDLFVDFSDWAVFADAWQSTPASPNWNRRCDIAPAGGDEIVDMDDIVVFMQQWLTTGSYYRHLDADIAPDRRDGVVNMLDFAALAENWLN